MSEHNPPENPNFPVPASRANPKPVLPTSLKIGFSSSVSGPKYQGNSENFGRPVDYKGMPLKKGDKGTLSKASTQSIEEQAQYGTYALDLVDPPNDLNFLVNLNGISVTRRSCIEAAATNTALLGYRIKRTDPEADETDEDDISEAIKTQLEKWSAKGGLSFSELIYQVKFD